MLREALNEVSRGPAEIQALADDLGAFGRMLQQVDLTLSARRGNLRPDVMNGVQRAVETCNSHLRTMESRIRGYRTRITAAKGSAVWRLYWNAATWGILGGKKEVEGLRARLFEQLSVIQIYMAVLTSSDRDALAKSTCHQEAAIQHLCASMKDIQLRFDVGIPPFHFSDPRTGRYYQPFARTSIQRLCDLFWAVNGSQLPVELPASGNSFLQTVRLARRQNSVVVPCIFAINCFFFREAAFGEWQVLLGFHLLDQKNAEQLSATLRIFRTLVERKHAIGAPCTCDGAHCHVRFQREIQTSIYRKQCLECYSSAASIVFGKALDSYADLSRYCKQWDAVQRGIEREITPCPDPEYVESTVLPALRASAHPGIDDMLRLFDAAPKRQRPDGIFRDFRSRTTTLQDLQSLRGWHHNPVLRFWDLL
ncbi:hypothetical protein AURDEDRAFT_186919 [Auricularia subglabra TFB-10046 SS5]|nr:hypothetical protein AURDEDRAFT_186919 [Auricularia subglabra TFB-10046 SS5]